MEENPVEETQTTETTESTPTEPTEPVTTETTEPVEPTVDIDYSEQLDNIQLLMENQNEILAVISDGTNMVFVYGYIVGPLLILCTMLWWFFKQFLYKF